MSIYNVSCTNVEASELIRWSFRRRSGIKCASSQMVAAWAMVVCSSLSLLVATRLSVGLMNHAQKEEGVDCAGLVTIIGVDGSAPRT
jgi:hypothetical protein